MRAYFVDFWYTSRRDGIFFQCGRSLWAGMTGRGLNFLKLLAYRIATLSLSLITPFILETLQRVYLSSHDAQLNLHLCLQRCPPSTRLRGESCGAPQGPDQPNTPPDIYQLFSDTE